MEWVIPFSLLELIEHLKIRQSVIIISTTNITIPVISQSKHILYWPRNRKSNKTRIVACTDNQNTIKIAKWLLDDRYIPLLSTK